MCWAAVGSLAAASAEARASNFAGSFKFFLNYTQHVPLLFFEEDFSQVRRFRHQ
jgi:hypothetical protein